MSLSDEFDLIRECVLVFLGGLFVVLRPLQWTLVLCDSVEQPWADLSRLRFAPTGARGRAEPANGVTRRPRPRRARPSLRGARACVINSAHLRGDVARLRFAS